MRASTVPIMHTTRCIDSSFCCISVCSSTVLASHVRKPIHSGSFSMRRSVRSGSCVHRAICENVSLRRRSLTSFSASSESVDHLANALVSAERQSRRAARSTSLSDDVCRCSWKYLPVALRSHSEKALKSRRRAAPWKWL